MGVAISNMATCGCVKSLYLCCWNDKRNSFPPIRIVSLLCTSLSYLLDVVFDSVAAWEHLDAYIQHGSHSELYYFGLTLGFILLPTLIINLLSLCLYTWTRYLCNRKSKTHEPVPVSLHPITTEIMQYDTNVSTSAIEEIEIEHSHVNSTNSQEIQQEDTDHGVEFYHVDDFSPVQSIGVVVVHILQLGFAFRVVRLLYRRNKDKYSFDRYRELSFLRLMEAFLESAPQLLLQLYIVSLEDIPDIARKAWTVIVVIFSTISLSLAIADYSSACKDVLYYDPPPVKERKPRLSWLGYFLIILWHLFMTISRAISIVLFATVFGWYCTFLIVLIHYVIIFHWLKTSNRNNSTVWIESVTDFSTSNHQPHKRSCKQCCCNAIIQLLAAAFNVFFLFKVYSGDSVGYITSYYILFFYENVFMICLWYVSVDYLWYLHVAPITVVLCFIIGLLLMLVYYWFFQPKDKPNLARSHSTTHPLVLYSMS